MNSNPVLSLCIPTYNRGDFLKAALARITSEDVFVNSDKVEVVISDNCSTDNTKDVCMSFVNAFPEKVRYFRNSVNTGMMDNFSKILRHGRGKFLKLQNDNFIMRHKSIDFIVSQIEDSQAGKPVIFFMCGAMGSDEDLVTSPENFDQFISDINIWSTWIGGFGLWKDDYDAVWPAFVKYAHSLEPNTGALLEYFRIRKCAKVVNRPLYESLNAQMTKKGGYNPAQAFIFNYAKILRDYMRPGEISKKVYRREIRRSYWHGFFIYFDFGNKNEFERGRFLLYSREHFFKGYFWLSWLYYVYRKVVRTPALPFTKLPIVARLAKCVDWSGSN